MLPATKMGHVIYEIVQKQPFFTAGIERLVKAFRQDLKVCLLCSEGRPTDCHRSKLIGVALDALEIPVVHLGPGERLLTIGVYGKSETKFFDQLSRAGVDLFCDIRQRRGVRSAQYVFANSTWLQAGLATRGIAYQYVPQLAPTGQLGKFILRLIIQHLCVQGAN